MRRIHLLKAARKWHRKTAAVLFALFFLISITAILLGWKNLFATKIYSAPAGSSGRGTMRTWMPLDSLSGIAAAELHNRVAGSGNALPIAMNAALDKGTMKITFRNNYVVQLDGRSGMLISIEKKATDLLIRIHDGEILDDIFHSGKGVAKTTYTSLMGLALFFLTLSGFWLRYGQRRARPKDPIS